MPVAQDEIEINVAPEKVYQVIVDYESYPEFLPEVAKIGVERSDDSTLVHYTIKIKALLKTMTTTYTLVKEEKPDQPDQGVIWDLVDSDDVIENSGSWKLSPLDGGSRTRALYTIEAFTYNIPIPQIVYDTLTRINLPRTLRAFKARAEALDTQQ